MNISLNIPIILAAAQEQQNKLNQTIAELLEFDEDMDDMDEEDINNAFRVCSVPRSIWMHKRFGQFWEKDVAENNEEFVKESFRLEKDIFSILVSRLEVLRKRDTSFRKEIPLSKRVAIALYTLGSSAEYRTIERLFGVSANSVCNILHEFCRAFISEFADEYLPANFLTEELVDDCVKGFEKIGFPQCIGAIDGCHIEIKPTEAETTDHFNYKGWYSIVLFACVDYRFIYANVGCPGRCNDSLIYRKSDLRQIVESSSLLHEKEKDICGTKVPLLLIGDSAFKFSPNLMKPYLFSTSASVQQKTFNIHLSRARRVVENAFGHLKARFRRIGKGLDCRPKNNAAIIICCCILHNLLNTKNSNINESWNLDQNRHRPQPDESNTSSDFVRSAETIRRAIADHFLHLS
ncbi:putative nuclease HARBI1 isoform X2 [Drosophila takahashii]|uniref:putative nuclease HARBI1 isoform X2 n=1 Tax=Drosophila takahashii TaxID=29030 RepID=UPI0038993FBE